MKTSIKNQFRWIMIAALAMVFSLGVGGSRTFASNIWSVKVDNTYLALRTEKVFDYNNEIGQLYTGDLVDVVDTSDSTYWYVYSSKYGKYGYVKKAYLVQTNQSVINNSYTVSNLKEGYLALRTAKAFDYNNEIGKLYNGDTVTVSDSSDSTYWYVYSSKLGKYGYVNKNYLTANNQTVQVTGNYVVANLKEGYLALRNAKAYDYNNEIGKLYNGDYVTVTDTTDSTYWYVTSSKLGLSGYVNKNYLAAVAQQTVSGETYTVANLKEGYLALRTAKAYDYSNEIGKLYNGDTVVVTDKSDASYWYVTSSKLGLSGYVNKDYLTK